MRSIRSANTRYATNPPPVDPSGFGEWALTELTQLSQYVQSIAEGQYEKQHVAPDKLKPGMIRYADGTNWAPGTGEGLYFYTSAWRKVVTIPAGADAFIRATGGAVTQATNKSTAVTLNTDSGEITMNGAALAAATIVSFTVNNTTVAAKDGFVVCHALTGTIGAYTVNMRATGTGTAQVTIRNNTAGSLSEAIVIRFTRVPGAIA